MSIYKGSKLYFYHKETKGIALNTSQTDGEKKDDDDNETNLTIHTNVRGIHIAIKNNDTDCQSIDTKPQT